jgi:hypothetical protein
VSKSKRGRSDESLRPHIHLQCPGQDLNLHGIAPASPSSWCVCQFRHPGAIRELLRAVAAIQGAIVGSNSLPLSASETSGQSQYIAFVISIRLGYWLEKEPEKEPRLRLPKTSRSVANLAVVVRSDCDSCRDDCLGRVGSDPLGTDSREGFWRWTFCSPLKVERLHGRFVLREADSRDNHRHPACLQFMERSILHRGGQKR